MKNSAFYILLIISILLGACSVQKRIYRKGYHVVWDHKKYEDVKKNVVAKNVQEKIIHQEVAEKVMVSSSRDLIDVRPKPSLLLKDTCGDKLLLQNAEELSVKVIEVSESSIKYKRCDNLNGPLFTISKTKVALITYANGTKETIIAEPEPKIDVKAMKDPDAPIKRKVNMKGLASLVSLPLNVILLVVLLFLVLLNAPGASLIAVFTAIGVCILLGIILGYLSLFDFKNKPKLYKHKWMPIVALSIYLAYGAILTLSLMFNAPISTMAIAAVIILALLGLFIYALLPKKEEPSKLKQPYR